MVKTIVNNLMLITGIWGIGSLNACKQPSDEIEALKTEVIKIHDRVMPQNAELMKNTKALGTLIASLDSIKKARPETDTLRIRRQADSLITVLKKAEEKMSDWMFAFETDYSTMDKQATIDYLNGEKAKIQDIEQAYKESIEGARALLEL